MLEDFRQFERKRLGPMEKISVECLSRQLNTTRTRKIGTFLIATKRNQSARNTNFIKNPLMLKRFSMWRVFKIVRINHLRICVV
jgi:hypothetical protein